MLLEGSRSSDSLLIDRQPEAMRFGIMRRQIVIQPCPTTPGEMPEGTLRAILREAHIDVNEFLNLK
jgi:hypothetical protein